MSPGPMADYPHASAACLCYLDEREGGAEGESEDAERLMFSLLSLPCWSVHPVLLAIGNWQEKERERGKERKRVSGPTTAV